MLRDLFENAGVLASDATRLRIYLVCKECARRGYVTLIVSYVDHFLSRNMHIPVEQHASFARALELIQAAVWFQERRPHYQPQTLPPRPKFMRNCFGRAQVVRGMFAWLTATAHGLVASRAITCVSARTVGRCETSITARVMHGYICKLQVRPAARVL
jgi:hypothetical protein